MKAQWLLVWLVLAFGWAPIVAKKDSRQNASSNASREAYSNATGSATGNATRNVTGSATGNATGNATGQANATSKATGEATGMATGKSMGNATRNKTGAANASALASNASTSVTRGIAINKSDGTTTGAPASNGSSIQRGSTSQSPKPGAAATTSTSSPRTNASMGQNSTPVQSPNTTGTNTSSNSARNNISNLTRKPVTTTTTNSSHLATTTPPLTGAPVPTPPPTRAPTPAPTPEEDDKDDSCTSVTDWMDSKGVTCLDYVAKRLCTPKGDYGSGWDQVYQELTFDSVKYDGHTALTACCACGGGVRGAGSGGASSMWKVLMGSCVVDAEGCLTSPNYPAFYGTSQGCKVSVIEERATPINAVEFKTEAQYDILAINGKRYSGTDGPRGVTPQGTVVWTSDSMDRNRGWKLCPGTPSIASPASPRSPPPGYSGFWVASGLCTVDSTGCVVSPNYPQPYGHNQDCSIQAINMINPTISADNFLTEMTYDYMEVNGKRFSGTNGPKRVAVVGPITWTSDYAQAKAGWRLCREVATHPVTQRTGATATRPSSKGTVAPPPQPQGSFMWVAALLGITATITACGFMYRRRSRSKSTNMESPYEKTTYGRKAGWDGL